MILTEELEFSLIASCGDKREILNFFSNFASGDAKLLL